jgi:hypothetical protein
VRLRTAVVDHGVLQLIPCHDQFLRQKAPAIIGKRYPIGVLNYPYRRSAASADMGDEPPVC